MNCGHCTFLNPLNTQICQMCFKSSKPIVSNVNEDTNGLQCDACTFLNHSDVDVCEVCGANMYFDDNSLFGSVDEEDIIGNLFEMMEGEIASSTKV